MAAVDPPRATSEESDPLTAQAPTLREHGNAYNIFILVLTIFSLALMVLLLLPVDERRASCSTSTTTWSA